MSQKTTLLVAFQDFILSKRAALCSPATIEHYEQTAGKFVAWMDGREITPLAIREYVSFVASRDVQDSTVFSHAKGIRTLVNFMLVEGYLDETIKVTMPKVRKKKLPVLSVEEVQTLLKCSNTPRDKALLMLMIDTGIRKAEVANLKWDDINLENGLVVVRGGKGNKDRSVVIGTRL